MVIVDKCLQMKQPPSYHATLNYTIAVIERPSGNVWTSFTNWQLQLSYDPCFERTAHGQSSPCSSQSGSSLPPQANSPVLWRPRGAPNLPLVSAHSRTSLIYPLGCSLGWHYTAFKTLTQRRPPGHWHSCWTFTICLWIIPFSICGGVKSVPSLRTLVSILD